MSTFLEARIWELQLTSTNIWEGKDFVLELEFSLGQL